MDPFAVAMADNSDDAILFEDVDGMTLFANHRWDVLTAGGGGSPAAIALTFRLFPDEVIRAQEKIAESAAGGQAVRFQSRLAIGVDAGPWVTVSRVPVRSHAGELVGWLTSVAEVASHLNPVDVSGIERTPANTAERLLHIGAVDWSVSTGTMWWSDGASEIFGLDPQACEPSYETWLASVHPDDRDLVIERIKSAFAGTQHFDLRYRVVRPDGAVITVRAQGDAERDAEGLPMRLLSTVQDITDEVDEDRARDRSGRAVATLLSAHAALVHATDEPSLLAMMCRAAVQSGGYPLAWYGRIEQTDPLAVVPAAAEGRAVAHLDDLTRALAEEPTGGGAALRAARSGSTVLIADMTGDAAYESWMAAAQEYGLAASLALPVREFEGLDGVLVVYATEKGGFDGAVPILEEVALQLGFGLERLATVRRTQDALEATIGVLAATAELRDPYTAGHQVRVAELAAAIAHAMGLPEFQARGIRLAALVHDIGKVSVPSELLTRPGRLRPLEFALIQGHALEGEKLLSTIDFPWPIATIVGQHHERIDGSGYPRGLTGDQTLLAARIVAVADVIEAMSRSRPYREALGMDAALAEITDKRGTTFDPAVVDACRQVISNGFAFTGMTQTR